MSQDPTEAAVTSDGPLAARIVLIGFMGVGKSTLAANWAARGGPVRWFDSDTHALRRLGATNVTDVFRDHGEAAWREAERSVILERADLPLAGCEIWSLGGGAIVDPDVQRALFGSTVLWLDAPVDLLWERVSKGAGSDRPLAQDRAEFERLYEERRATYEGLADLRIDASGAVDEVALPGSARELIPTEVILSQVLVAPGAVARLDELAAVHSRDVALVLDGSVAFLEDDLRSAVELAGGRVLDTALLSAGEWSKQLSVAEWLWNRWSDSHVHRRTLVLAAGGGTTLDVAGFAASAFARGLDWVAAPTTLLAQVDAGVGGKTGVNLGVKKNVVGTVHEPLLTVIDPNLLATLPPSEIASGMAEVVKTGLLAGIELMSQLPQSLPSPADAPAALGQVIAGCARFKELVVVEDMSDSIGIRAQLNLGHTLAHAIESATGGSYGHGRAVAVGTVVALELSAKVGLDAGITALARRLLSAYGLPTDPPLEWGSIAGSLVHDKKRDEHGIGWTLLSAPGEPLTRARIPTDEVRATWDRLRSEATGTARELPRPSDQQVHVLFGVNLGELGRRDPSQYGTQTLAELVSEIEGWGDELGLRVIARQTDDLARFLAAIREAQATSSALIINPGAWTHYELALHDAVEPLQIPVIEVHLSDVQTRAETWRHESVLEDVRTAVISGKGAAGYREALELVAAQVASDT